MGKAKADLTGGCVEDPYEVENARFELSLEVHAPWNIGSTAGEYPTGRLAHFSP
jgi:hypothetical protein